MSLRKAGLRMHLLQHLQPFCGSRWSPGPGTRHIGQNFDVQPNYSTVQGAAATEVLLRLARPTPVMPMANTTASAWCTV